MKTFGLLLALAGVAELRVIDGQYIVVFRDSIVDEIPADKAAWVESVIGSSSPIDSANTVDSEWSLAGFEAFAGTFTDEAIAKIGGQPIVEFVEKNAEATIFQGNSQPNAPWGLDRIDDRSGLDRTYTYTGSGNGVTAYVIDTGIQINHPDFGGRATWGANFVDRSNSDGNGHGTHVAGTIGGTTYGVAKNVDLVAVKVLDSRGSGSFAGVIDGINWVAQNARGPSVANMSLGGPASAAVDRAVAAAIRSGVTFVLAAGNNNGDACSLSPAREPSAITVGATDRRDRRSSFSNFGRCLDIFAPGTDITSTWNNGRTRTISGTSMAAPHVAGVAALILENGNSSPAAVARSLISSSTTGAVTNPGRGSPNNFLYSL